MLRYLTAIFLLATFLAQTFSKAVIVFDYYANTSAFAQACENKATPMMHCNGKCQMMKKLKEEEKKDQQAPERRGENKNEVVSSASHFDSVLVWQNSVQTSFEFYYHPLSPQHSAADIFHPPTIG